MAMTRKDPSKARQKFCTNILQGGCSKVAFYNHSSFAFGRNDQKYLSLRAKEFFSDLPDQCIVATPGSLFAWVDIYDEEIYIGCGLPSDHWLCLLWGATEGCVYIKNYPIHYNRIHLIVDALRDFAEMWKEREGSEKLSLFTKEITQENIRFYPLSGRTAK